MTGMVMAFCALAVTWLASAGNVFAENSDYQPPTNFPQGENRAEEITVNNIKRSYQLFNQFKKQHGESISSIPKLRGKERQLYGHQAPAQHPLDKYDGHLPNPVSWLEMRAWITIPAVPTVDLAAVQWALLLGAALIIWLVGNRLLFTSPRQNGGSHG